ncbi:branched-chain amino acid transport system substrate-binding protein [Massilia sp. UYP11]|uniref:ABC transporter substrate-binding protein n=1 Tax=Massilia sp. UYP11 TaxID=1756385 RepID=UPI003D252577
MRAHASCTVSNQREFEMKKTSLVVRTFAAAAGLLLAVGSSPVQAQDKQSCIGFSGALTGPATFSGDAARMGAEVALDEINAKGGVLGKKLTLKMYDDAGQPPKGVDNVRRIALADNCIAMLGGYHSGVALAMRDPIEKIGIPYVGVMAAGTKIIEPDSGTNKWMFRVSAKDRWVAEYLVDVALKRAPNKKVAVFYENTGWGNGAAPDVKAALLKNGVTPVAMETFNWGDQDMTAQLMRARAAGAEAIVMFALDREGNQILRGMDKLKYRPVIAGAWGLAGNLGEIAGPLANGVMVVQTFSWMGQQDARTAAVYAKIAQKFGLKKPSELKMGSGTANAYDAVYLIAKAIEVAGSYDRAKVRDALFRVKHQGLVANYNPAFGASLEKHDAILPKDYKLTVWQDGALLPLAQTRYK